MDPHSSWFPLCLADDALPGATLRKARSRLGRLLFLSSSLILLLCVTQSVLGWIHSTPLQTNSTSLKNASKTTNHAGSHDKDTVLPRIWGNFVKDPRLEGRGSQTNPGASSCRRILSARKREIRPRIPAPIDSGQVHWGPPELDRPTQGSAATSEWLSNLALPFVRDATRLERLVITGAP
ncbi:hypothetical protein B0T10DRAFT_457431 [Thelonectria olida]|uniref:Uncharacterized protein n=1 Tax=Thelonectria olida TaxID=1576542 RepID=A0A9P9ASX9_9HYPO|nr:hypothetical protein B0T10DRAFT_457431 [Thelonectria olida]